MIQVEVHASRIQGLGVFAASPIPAGELIREYNLIREVTPERPIDPGRGERIEHCTYPADRVFLVGFPDRHFNHSCDPNAYKRFRQNTIQVVSRRRIDSSAEITLDYMINTHGGTRWACNCESERCRGNSVPSFFDLPKAIQVEYLPLLAPWFVERHSERVGKPDDDA
jgi:SET domain-containing protein